MHRLLKTSILAALVALLALSAFAAPAAVQVARSYSAAGFAGCTVSGATNVNPIVVTCTAAHKLVDGDQIQITGVVGNTAANTTGFAKVTTYSTTTFGLYSDAVLATGVAGNGAYTSGGAVSQAFDISGYGADWTIRARLDSLTAGKRVLVAVQDSADGFVSDIKTLGVFNITSNVPVSGVDYTWRSYQLPSARFGVANGRLRLLVQSIDGSATAAISVFVE